MRLGYYRTPYLILLLYSFLLFPFAGPDCAVFSDGTYTLALGTAAGVTTFISPRLLQDHGVDLACLRPTSFRTPLTELVVERRPPASLQPADETATRPAGGPVLMPPSAFYRPLVEADDNRGSNDAGPPVRPDIEILDEARPSAAADFIPLRSDLGGSGTGNGAARLADAPERVRSDLSRFAPLPASGRPTSFDVDLAEARRVTSSGLPRYGTTPRTDGPGTRVPSGERRRSPPSRQRSLSPGRRFSSSRRRSPSPRRSSPSSTSRNSTGGPGMANARPRAGFVRGQRCLPSGTRQPSSFLPPQYRRPRHVHDGHVATRPARSAGSSLILLLLNYLRNRTYSQSVCKFYLLARQAT